MEKRKKKTLFFFNYCIIILLQRESDIKGRGEVDRLGYRSKRFDVHHSKHASIPKWSLGKHRSGGAILSVPNKEKERTPFLASGLTNILDKRYMSIGTF